MPISMGAIQGPVMGLAILSSLALIVLVLARRRLAALHWSFALGMAGFLIEDVGAYMLLTSTETSADQLMWLRVVEVAGVAVLPVWACFVTFLGHAQLPRVPQAWQVGLVVATLAALGAAAGLFTPRAFALLDEPGRFLAARLDIGAQAATIVALLMTIGVLAGLEACLRTSAGPARWRLKYLMLGLGGILLVRFYLLSNMLLFGVMMADYLTTAAATLFIGNLSMGAALLRDRLTGAALRVSRQMMYRSVVVGVLGVYLFVIGGLGWLLGRLGVAEELFWGSLIVFVSAVALAAVLLSEDLRWRIKRFVAFHFYRSKYDYREQWVAFTTRLGSRLTLEDLAPQLLEAVTAAIGTTSAALYLGDARDERYHLAGVAGAIRPAPTLEEDSPLVAWGAAADSPRQLEPAGPAPSALTTEVTRVFPEAAVAVPLRWHGTLIGVMLVGPERAGAVYTPEDIEFLATVGEQAAGAIVTARLSETVAQSREFEAFHRLTSFVIHDVKNSISALSMLSENALRHFDDPEFQRDTVKTLSRTVDRMRGLLAKLSTAPESTALRSEPVELAGLAREVAAAVGHPPGVMVSVAGTPEIRARGDREALFRVLQNLLKNAVEALEGKGQVTVTVGEEPRWGVVTVSDTGCGMSSEFLRKSLFAPFRSTKKGGWGIGLYEAKAIVEAGGGRIDVASKEGEGTTFWVRLPR